MISSAQQPMELPAWLNFPRKRRIDKSPTEPSALGDQPFTPPVQPIPPMTDRVAAPIDLPSPEVLSPVDMNRARRDIHPQIDPTIPDELAREKQYRADVEAYEPQKPHGFKGYVAPIVKAALAGGAAGIPGLIGGAAFEGLNQVLDPTHTDREWKNRELGHATKTVNVANDLANDTVTRQYKQAEIDKLQEDKPDTRPRPTSYRVLTKDETINGQTVPKGTKIQREYNPKTRQWEDTNVVLDLQTEPATKAPPAISGHTRVVGEGEYAGIPAGTTIHLDYDGKDVLRDGKPLVAQIAPSEKEKEPTENFQKTAEEMFSAASENYRVAKQKRADAAAIVVGDDPVKLEDKKTLLAEATQLEKEARDWQQKGRELKNKPVKTSTATPKAQPYAGRRWSASAWLKANPNGDVNAARAAAKAAGATVVD